MITKKKNYNMVNRAIAILLSYEPELQSRDIADTFGVKLMRVAAIRAHIKMGNNIGNIKRKPYFNK
jgi:predicted transcriptional regulator